MNLCKINTLGLEGVVQYNTIFGDFLDGRKNTLLYSY